MLRSINVGREAYVNVCSEKLKLQIRFGDGVERALRWSDNRMIWAAM